MALVDISEIFGYDIDDNSADALKCQTEKTCPFRGKRCNKGNLDKPLGICTFASDGIAGAVCPTRFLEEERIFLDVARTAFGSGTRIIIAPEIRILKIPGEHERKIGKVDFIIGKLNDKDEVCDFAALEIQAVYFSGASIVGAFNTFLDTRKLPNDSKRRLDYRSSAQKRLMPQLNLKVPVFRRWGKKFFVAVDSLFFNNLPLKKSVSSIDNSEITWLVYSFKKENIGYRMSNPEIHYTLWEDVLNDLREGKEPTPAEIMNEISLKKKTFKVLNA